MARNGVKQYFLEPPDDLELQISALLELYSSIKIRKAVLFVRDYKVALRIAEAFELNLFKPLLVHNDMSFNEKEDTFTRFDNYYSRLLISTDTEWKRDFDNVSHLFNFDVPLSIEVYKKRIYKVLDIIQRKRDLIVINLSRLNDLQLLFSPVRCNTILEPLTMETLSKLRDPNRRY